MEIPFQGVTALDGKPQSGNITPNGPRLYPDCPRGAEPLAAARRRIHAPKERSATGKRDPEW
ncbi:hypothetical protein GCM10014713_62970 [Streptomyces purpureus]|uniref:Uncharacterized protein n=1 Tax=Streptomyces purpureus TaxID=1951 RepID=A0A918HHH2_9ACTN|nr:hypothetical protein GCM10014713_62970 [Streptomyces purpureus]